MAPSGSWAPSSQSASLRTLATVVASKTGGGTAVVVVVALAVVDVVVALATDVVVRGAFLAAALAAAAWDPTSAPRPAATSVTAARSRFTHRLSPHAWVTLSGEAPVNWRISPTNGEKCTIWGDRRAQVGRQ